MPTVLVSASAYFRQVAQRNIRSPRRGSHRRRPTAHRNRLPTLVKPHFLIVEPRRRILLRCVHPLRVAFASSSIGAGPRRQAGRRRSI
jgi:hypothetical protein